MCYCRLNGLLCYCRLKGLLIMFEFDTVNYYKEGAVKVLHNWSNEIKQLYIYLNDLQTDNVLLDKNDAYLINISCK